MVNGAGSDNMVGGAWGDGHGTPLKQKLQCRHLHRWQSTAQADATQLRAQPAIAVSCAFTGTQARPNAFGGGSPCSVGGTDTSTGDGGGGGSGSGGGGGGAVVRRLTGGELLDKCASRGKR